MSIGGPIVLIIGFIPDFDLRHVGRLLPPPVSPFSSDADIFRDYGCLLTIVYNGYWGELLTIYFASGWILLDLPAVPLPYPQVTSIGWKNN